MFPVELTENLMMDIDAAAEEMCARAPELSRIVRAFALLAREREELEIDFPRMPVPEFDEEAFGAGEPLVSGIDLSAFHAGFIRSAQRLLPVIGKVFPPMEHYASALREALDTAPQLPEMAVNAFFADGPDAFECLARETAVPIGALSFLVVEILKPCLRKIEERTGRLAEDSLWFKGQCPVCGGGPDYGLLKEKRDTSDFLLSRSGRLWLHCPMCGHFWRFVRLVCPACGESDHDRLDVVTARGRDRERIHGCRSCNRYLPVIDLVGSRRKLHPDLAHLGFIPLDILAGKAGFTGPD